MKFTTKQYICIQTNHHGSPWWKLDTLSYTMKDSKRMLLGDSKLTWKELYTKYGWICVKVELNMVAINTPKKCKNYDHQSLRRSIKNNL